MPVETTLSDRCAPLAVVLDGSETMLGTAGFESSVNTVADGWRIALEAHEQLGVPVTARLTGAFVEAIAWQAPELLDRMRSLVAGQLLELVGTTYIDAPLLHATADLARLQLTEGLRILEHHLGVDAAALTAAWVPRCAWRTEVVAPFLTDADLPNGGFDWVLLDDRSLVPGGMAAGDLATPSPADAARLAALTALRRITGTKLSAAPISTALSQWFPMRGADDLRWSRELAFAVCRLGSIPAVLVWAGRPDGERYARGLRRLTLETPVTPIALPRWLADQEPKEEIEVEADPNESRGSDQASPEATARTFELVEGQHGDLVQLARRRLAMLHQHAAPVLASAARWLALPPSLAWAEMHDIDDDGEEEVVLGNDRLHVVLSPARGARIVSLAVATSTGGALGVTDDPGALVLVDGEDDRWKVRSISDPGDEVSVELENVEPDSPHHGARLQLRLVQGADHLVASYRLPAKFAVVLSALSPDYAHLLREGRSALHVLDEDHGCVVTAGRVRVRLTVPISDRSGTVTVWRDAPFAEPSHTHLVALRAHSNKFTVHIGADEID
jgi:hypothetical protein